MPLYTPELSDYHSAVLRRISWAIEKPMTKSLSAILEIIAQALDEKKICEKCKDPKCQTGKDCIFKTGHKVAVIDISSIQKEEPKMKVKEIAVMASKKVAHNFNSCALSYTATAEIEEGEEFLEVIQNVKDQLVQKLQQGLLPQQNGKLNAAT